MLHSLPTTCRCAHRARHMHPLWLDSWFCVMVHGKTVRCRFGIACRLAMPTLKSTSEGCVGGWVHCAELLMQAALLAVHSGLLLQSLKGCCTSFCRMPHAGVC